MLHDIINEQGNGLNVRDDISEKNIPHKFKDRSLASGAFILGIIIISYNKLTDLCYRRYK